MLGDHPIHPVLLAKDLGAAREFYHDRIGLEILTDNEEAIVFRCGNGTHLDVTRSTDLGFAWMAWIVDPGRNALAIVQLKG